MPWCLWRFIVFKDQIAIQSWWIHFESMYFCSAFSTILPHHRISSFWGSSFHFNFPKFWGVSLLKSSAWKLIEVWTSTASVSWGWLGISFQLCQCRYVNCIFVNPKKKEIMKSKFRWSSKWSNDCFLPWSFGNFESKVGVCSCHEFPKVTCSKGVHFCSRGWCESWFVATNWHHNSRMEIHKRIINDYCLAASPTH